MVMSTKTLATTKVKIAKIYALVQQNLNDIHGKLNNIEFCYKFRCIWPLGRLAAIIIDILYVQLHRMSNFSFFTLSKLLSSF